MNNSHRRLIYEDIFASYKISQGDLDAYTFYREDNITWLYTPLVVRHENESLVSSWSYVLNEDKILSSQIYLLGEDNIANSKFSSYINNIKFQANISEVEKILNKNFSMFPDKTFENKIDLILKKYSVEIIIQDLNYRIRIRPLLVQEIKYDLYYDQKENKLNYNIFNPDLD